MPRYRKKRGGRRYEKKSGRMENPMIKDFLVGTCGKVLQVVLVGVGIFLLISGLIDDPQGRLLVGRIIGGILCLCASFGVRYALGHIVRFRR